MLGGICFDIMESYTLMWCIDIVLCGIVGFVSYIIIEKMVV